MAAPQVQYFTFYGVTSYMTSLLSCYPNKRPALVNAAHRFCLEGSIAQGEHCGDGRRLRG